MKRSHLHLPAALFFLGITVVFCLNLFPVWNSGIPGGMEDTRLFLWNSWWFHYAIHTLFRSPYFTPLLFHPFGCSLLSHDFPLWNNLVSELGQDLGMNWVGGANAGLFLSWLLAGFCSYGLAWEVTRRRGPAIIAGLYVMTQSYTLARLMENWGQFNLYGIALFLWMLVRAERTGRSRDFILAGIALAWTAACHYYFLIYSGLIAALALAVNVWPWRYRFRRLSQKSRLSYFFFGLATIAGSIAAWILILHPSNVILGSLKIGLESPANALLVMWITLGLGVLCQWSVQIEPRLLDTSAVITAVRGGLLLFGTALLCLSPLLWSAFQLARRGDYPRQTILWKTHLEGASVLSFFLPNPLQAFWGPRVSNWLIRHDIQPQEQAASIGWVCLALVIWSGLWRRAGIARRWLALAIGASICALGVYLHFFVTNTWLPLPFYFLRLLPVLGNVRVPERWMAVGAIAWAVVLALALIQLIEKNRWRPNRAIFAVGLLVLCENWPGVPLGTPPLHLSLYDRLAALPPGGVLNLPLYIGDSSIGAGAAPAGFAWDADAVQIYHRHPILGGYIGRIPRRLIRVYTADPLFGRLIQLEEGTTQDATPLDYRDACTSADHFQMNYILAYPEGLSPDAYHFINGSLPLILLDRENNVELYRVDCRR